MKVRFAELPRALMNNEGVIPLHVQEELRWQYDTISKELENFKNDHELVLAIVSRIWILKLLHSLIESFKKKFFSNQLWFYTFAVHVVYHQIPTSPQFLKFTQEHTVWKCVKINHLTFVLNWKLPFNCLNGYK